MAGEISCVCLLSGGMDSATLVGLAKIQFDKVAALTISYGQRHEKEIDCAVALAKHYNIPHKFVDLSAINSLLQGSALTTDSIKVPTGHYAEDNMKLTVVPARNTILLSIAAGYAISIGFTHVAYAAHAGDHAIYPDCRGDYIEAMQTVFQKFHFTPIGIWTPFLDMDKGDILKEGYMIGVPYGLTWTCYNPQKDGTACGKCGSCVERIEGFHKLGKQDPVAYSGGWEIALSNALKVLRKGTGG